MQINSLQQSQISLLKSIFSLAEVKSQGLEYALTKEEFKIILGSIEETLFDGLRVTTEMQNPIVNRVHPIIQNVLNSVI